MLICSSTALQESDTAVDAPKMPSTLSPPKLPSAPRMPERREPAEIRMREPRPAIASAAVTPVIAEPTPSTNAGEANHRPGRALRSYLPQVVVATLLVAVLPVVFVWCLRLAGIVTSPWIALVLAVGLSSAMSSAGCAVWKRSKGSGDLLFGELLIWGWLGAGGRSDGS